MSCFVILYFLNLGNVLLSKLFIISSNNILLLVLFITYIHSNKVQPPPPPKKGGKKRGGGGGGKGQDSPNKVIIFVILYFTSSMWLNCNFEQPWLIPSVYKLLQLKTQYYLPVLKVPLLRSTADSVASRRHCEEKPRLLAWNLLCLKNKKRSFQ